MGLGVMHPPGAPGLSPLMRLAAGIPVGSLGFRAAALSCFLSAAAIGVMIATLLRRRVPVPLAALAGGWALCGITLLRQSRTIEIYSLSLLLCALVLWGLDPAARPAQRGRNRLIATFCAAWASIAFGDLRLALPPLVALVWWADLRRGRRWVAWAPLFVAAAMLVTLALPLASARGPASDWGDPDGVGRFVEHLRATSILRSYAQEILPASASLWGVHFRGVVLQLAEDLGPLGPGLALLGGASLWFRDRPVALALGWVIAVELFYGVGINPMGLRDRQTGLVLAMVCIAVGILALDGWTRERRLRWAVVPVAAAVLVLPAGLAAWGEGALARSWGPHAWTRAALAQLPPGAVLLTQTDDLAAGVTAAQGLEGARPDVLFAPSQHLYRAPPDRARDDPRLARLWAAAASGQGEAGRVMRAIESVPSPTAVALEMPATGLLGKVEFWSTRGAVPLRVRYGDPPVGPPPNPLERARTEAARWAPELTTPEDRRRLAIALAALGRGTLRVYGPGALPEVVAILELVLDGIDPTHAASWVALGALHDRAGRPDLAIAATREALVLEPERPAALENLALYLGRDPATRGEALAVAERAASLRPWRRQGWVRLAALRRASGDAEGAQAAQARADAL